MICEGPEEVRDKDREVRCGKTIVGTVNRNEHVEEFRFLDLRECPVVVQEEVVRRLWGEERKWGGGCEEARATEGRLVR